MGLCRGMDGLGGLGVRMYHARRWSEDCLRWGLDVDYVRPG